MKQNFDIVIVGGGILGTCIAYFLSYLNNSKDIAVIEQAHSIAFHTSSRNTGKVHAPYLYNPDKKKLFAKAAFHGFEMWERYAKLQNLPFKRDGVIEVALDQDGINTLEKYHTWGIQNGLSDKEINIVDSNELKKIESEIKCHAALCVSKDASTDYLALTSSIMKDTSRNGISFLLGKRVTETKKENGMWKITLNNTETVYAKYMINAAGGESIDIAHRANIAKDFTDVHFRGEYLKVPKEYSTLTKTSIYSVPEFPEYPFLDPHWIIRVNGDCEIGPNAVPVFSPYGYNKTENLKEVIPKTIEMLSSGAKKTIFNKQFQELALNEIQSSISKTAMINRVKRFLPKINPDRITEKGTAGIRSSIIDKDGGFVPDVMLYSDESSCHILNYNSPGATGALPFAAHVVNQLKEEGLLDNTRLDAQCGPWKFTEIIDKLQEDNGS